MDENDISQIQRNTDVMSNRHSSVFGHRRIGENKDLIFKNRQGIRVKKELKYSHFLCFKVTHRTNRFIYSHIDKYTQEQEEIHTKIKSLKSIGMGYRRIANHLNQLEIKTIKENLWNNTNVYSVLKKYRERKKRLEIRDKNYKPLWGKIKIE